MKKTIIKLIEIHLETYKKWMDDKSFKSDELHLAEIRGCFNATTVLLNQLNAGFAEKIKEEQTHIGDEKMKEKVFKIKESYFERNDDQEFIDMPFIEGTLEEWEGEYESWVKNWKDYYYSEEESRLLLDFPTWEDFKLILEEV